MFRAIKVRLARIVVGFALVHVRLQMTQQFTEPFGVVWPMARIAEWIAAVVVEPYAAHRTVVALIYASPRRRGEGAFTKHVVSRLALQGNRRPMELSILASHPCDAPTLDGGAFRPCGLPRCQDACVIREKTVVRSVGHKFPFQNGRSPWSLLSTEIGMRRRHTTPRCCSCCSALPIVVGPFPLV